MTQLKSKEISLVKLNEIMEEFGLIFEKTKDTHYDYYYFDLPNNITYVVFVNEKYNNIEFQIINCGEVSYKELFKTTRTLRNRLCEIL